jgi:hypothetical protein
MPAGDAFGKLNLRAWKIRYRPMAPVIASAVRSASAAMGQRRVGRTRRRKKRGAGEPEIGTVVAASARVRDRCVAVCSHPGRAVLDKIATVDELTCHIPIGTSVREARCRQFAAAAARDPATPGWVARSLTARGRA